MFWKKKKPEDNQKLEFILQKVFLNLKLLKYFEKKKNYLSFENEVLII
jgi:hypothetical protein